MVSDYKIKTVVWSTFFFGSVGRKLYRGRRMEQSKTKTHYQGAKKPRPRLGKNRKWKRGPQNKCSQREKRVEESGGGDKM